jgi:sister-chromatid-cohesion protein PDS5
VLSCLIGRLRDKKPAVRREVATQAAAVMRAWALASAADPGSAPRIEMILGIPLVLCNLAVRDTELGAHVFDVVFRAGIFPAKLAPSDVACFWALLWKQAGDEGRPVLAKILQGKAAIQSRVQELLTLRTAAKEARTSSLAGAGSSMGGGGAAAAASGSLAGAASGRPRGDPEKRLQERMHELAGVLRDVAKPEEGLQKLVEQRDNHVFRGLATLAAYGCTHKDAVAAGKDVLQRVGSKGAVADLTRVLVARLTPALLPPEVLHAAMEEAEGSQEAQRLLVDVAGAAPQLLAQSMDQVAGLFEADDPLLAECGAKVMARAGRLMLEACRAAKKEVPAELPERLAELCADGSPGCVKAAVKALVVVVGPEGAAKAAADLADRLLDRLKSSAARASHRALLAPLKGLSMLGRLLPAAFESCADEVADFVLNDLMAADLSRGKPLREFDPQRTGREWRRPSPTTEIKAAALRTLCQALVPDSSRFPITQAMAERARLVWEALEPLMDTDAAGEQFEPFDFVFPGSDGEQQRAKRRRVEGSDEEEEQEQEQEECTDAAWVRYSAVCGLLRLARAYDNYMPASLYANLALTLQEPLVEPRHAMTHKLARCVARLDQRPQFGQRASKYAACLAMFGIDPEERNRRYALVTLRDHVLQRRRLVQQQAATTAAAGGGGSMIQEMPEFMLPFLIFLLAHHPDYPAQEVLEEFVEASPEEREEEYEGGTPYSPFVAMLQVGRGGMVSGPRGGSAGQDRARPCVCYVAGQQS